MRILIYAINYSPELTGIGKYSGEMAEWLSSIGYDVHAVVAPPYYPDWKVTNSYKSWRYHHEVINGVDVYRCPLYVPNVPTGIKRILHLGSFAMSSIPMMFKQLLWKPDIIFVIEPPLFCSPVALLISKFSKSKSWLHIQDYEVDAAFNLGLLTSKRLHRFVLCCERYLMKKFDVVSTISNPMIKLLCKKGVERNKSIYFPNWVDVDQIFPIKNTNAFRKKMGVNESAIVALYSGNMGEKQGLEIIIEAAKFFHGNQSILFVMCGNGSALSKLKVNSVGLHNIIWMNLQPVNLLNELLNMADIHLLPQRPDAADLVMPSKLTGMMASGKPVLTTAKENTEISNVLIQNNIGVVVPPCDVKAFVKGLKYLSINPQLRKLLGDNARKYAIEHLSKDVVLKKLDQYFKKIG